MSRICELTGKRRQKGNKVSHSNIKTRCFKQPNLVKKRYLVPELGRTISLTLSSAALRTIDARGGISRAIAQEPDKYLSERLLSVKRSIQKKQTNQTKKKLVAKEA